MDILPEPTAFEWDKGNISKNFVKHDVTPQEAEEIFSNEPLVLARDAEHSTVHGRRYFALGRTKSGRKLFATFMIRSKKIRIISIRDMTKAEEDAYEDFEKNS